SSSFFYFLTNSSSHHSDPHSFPTRRSSDLDWDYDVHRPDEITLQLVREVDGEDVVVDETTVQDNGTAVWSYEFEEAVVYDSKGRSEEHTSELQSRFDLVCHLLLEKKKSI